MSSVGKMTSRREDGFNYRISSDGCKSIFPENGPNNFRILLSDPIDFPDDEDWEVGLLDIYYPCSWMNIGPDSRMKYMTRAGLKEITFPRWHYRNLEEIVNYIGSQLPKDLYQASVDGFGRFQLESKNLYCDVAFTGSLCKILGLDEEDTSLSESSIVRRSYALEHISDLWKDEINYMETEQALVDAVKEADDDAVKVIRALQPYLNFGKLAAWKKKDVELADPKLEKSWDKIAEIFGVEVLSDVMKKNLKNFHRRFSSVYGKKQRLPPKVIISTRPVSLNSFDLMQVRTSIIQPIDVNNVTENILKTVYIRDAGLNTAQEIFVHPTYEPVKRGGKISSIDVYITKESGDLVPFESGTVSMTLQFRKHKY